MVTASRTAHTPWLSSPHVLASALARCPHPCYKNWQQGVAHHLGHASLNWFVNTTQVLLRPAATPTRAVNTRAVNTTLLPPRGPASGPASGPTLLGEAARLLSLLRAWAARAQGSAADQADVPAARVCIKVDAAPLRCVPGSRFGRHMVGASMGHQLLGQLPSARRQNHSRGSWWSTFSP